QGLVPFEGMPHLADPPRGWVVTANNRVAPDDFPYPLSGTWGDGYRARRIRQMIEAREGPALSRADCGAMHQDALSLRGVNGVPPLLTVLRASADPRVQQAVKHLEAWDGHMEPDRVGAALFDVFFALWAKAVMRARF